MKLSDSASAQCDAWGGSLQCGLGRCTRCNCVKFMGNGNICEYCGHDYDDHSIGPPFVDEADEEDGTLAQRRGSSEL
jgi:hypothetical protein